MVGLLLLLEQLVPYERRWGMTWRHLWRRDLVFIAINGATLAMLGWGLAVLSIEVAAQSQGVAAAWPLWMQVVVGLLAFEALQYSTHASARSSTDPECRRASWGCARTGIRDSMRRFEARCFR